MAPSTLRSGPCRRRRSVTAPSTRRRSVYGQSRPTKTLHPVNPGTLSRRAASTPRRSRDASTSRCLQAAPISRRPYASSTPRRPYASSTTRRPYASSTPRRAAPTPSSPPSRTSSSPPLRLLDPVFPYVVEPAPRPPRPHFAPTPPRPASPYVVDPASVAPLKMPHSEEYKIPHGFSICHSRELEGKVITYRDGDVVDLQEDLIQSYNNLAASYNKYRVVDCWLKGVGERANTDLMEERLANLRRRMRNDRNETVSLMTQIMKAGAEPLPPDAPLDADVAAALDSTVLLRDAAITAGGGQQAISEFRLCAIQSMDEAITSTFPNLIAKVEEHLRDQQARVEQRAAQAQDRADAEAKAKANVYAQGPSADVVHRRKEAELRSEEARQDEKMRRQKALDKLKGDRLRRCRSPPPRG